MCGRFTLTGGTRLLLRFKEQYGVEVEEPEDMERLLPDRGVTFLPFHDVPVFYTDHNGVTSVKPMYWQLIHYWSKDFKSKYTQFNTRADSLGKRHNRDLLERHRCIFPVSSFYETHKVGGRTVMPKESYEFTLRGLDIIPLGGIYSVWTNPEDDGDRRYSCSIITVEPNSLVAEIHNRMPFILAPGDVSTWLDRGVSDFDRLMEMVGPYDAKAMLRSREGGEGTQMELKTET